MQLQTGDGEWNTVVDRKKEKEQKKASLDLKKSDQSQKRDRKRRPKRERKSEEKKSEAKKPEEQPSKDVSKYLKNHIFYKIVILVR